MPNSTSNILFMAVRYGFFDEEAAAREDALQLLLDRSETEPQVADFLRRMKVLPVKRKPREPTGDVAPIVDQHAAFYNALLHAERSTLHATVVTAADAGYFVALQCLVVSLRLSHDCKVVVFDLGLTRSQRDWLDEHGCEVRPTPDLAFTRERFFWQSWNKPLFLDQVKGPLLWLDADAIVTGPLTTIDELLRDRPVFFSDSAAIHFNGWREGVRGTTNESALYEDYPVRQRFRPGDHPNAGVIAIDATRPRDRRILDTWLKMVRLAADDDALSPPRNATSQHQHGLLRWHDQGALQWTLEKLGECDLVLADQRFNDPVRCVGAKSLDELVVKLHDARTTRVVHFPCDSKPYAYFPEDFSPNVRGYPLNRTDLTLLVLGHETDVLARIDAPHARTIYLPSLDPDNDLAESRVFASNVLTTCETEYVGLCTQRWDAKYAGRCWPLRRLYRLPQRPSVVWAAAVADRGWLKYTEEAHPGMAAVVEELAGLMGVKNLKAPSVWSNNFIAHRSVVLALQEWVWRGLGIVRQRFGRWPEYGMDGADASRYGSYLAERISMLYFCDRDHLEIRQIPS